MGKILPMHEAKGDRPRIIIDPGPVARARREAYSRVQGRLLPWRVQGRALPGLGGAQLVLRPQNPSMRIFKATSQNHLFKF